MEVFHNTRTTCRSSNIKHQVSELKVVNLERNFCHQIENSSLTISKTNVNLFLGFGNNFSDWIDPAIVSFRQFPQFNPQQQQQAQNQANNDMYMPQMNQQPGNDKAQIFISSRNAQKSYEFKVLV